MKRTPVAPPQSCGSELLHPAEPAGAGPRDPQLSLKERRFPYPPKTEALKEGPLRLDGGQRGPLNQPASTNTQTDRPAQLLHQQPVSRLFLLLEPRKIKSGNVPQQAAGVQDSLVSSADGNTTAAPLSGGASRGQWGGPTQKDRTPPRPAGSQLPLAVEAGGLPRCQGGAGRSSGDNSPTWSRGGGDEVAQGRFVLQPHPLIP